MLEIEGETADVQQHFSTSSSSASASVGYGPFTVTASGARSETKTDSTCEATASGCRFVSPFVSDDRDATDGVA